MIREQDGRLPAASRQCAVQQLVDTVVLHAHRLRTDPVVRAGVRLALDQQAEGLDRGGSFRRWREVGAELLEQARERGELLPHVVPAETAGVLVGAFAGVQAISRSLSGYQDLPRRVSGLLRHVLPSVVIPGAGLGGPLRDQGRLGPGTAQRRRRRTESRAPHLTPPGTASPPPPRPSLLRPHPCPCRCPCCRCPPAPPYRCWC